MHICAASNDGLDPVAHACRDAMLHPHHRLDELKAQHRPFRRNRERRKESKRETESRENDKTETEEIRSRCSVVLFFIFFLGIYLRWSDIVGYKLKV